jgi:hypothetical protein
MSNLPVYERKIKLSFERFSEKFRKYLFRLLCKHYLTILRRVVKRLSQHNLKISYHRHI